MGRALSTPSERARAAEQQAFREQDTAQRGGAGAERGADRQFAFTANGARQNQIGDVGAGDDEDQPEAASSTQRRCAPWR